MKTILLKLLLLVSCFSFAQLPTDHIAEYRFTNGDLTNLANPGTGDLTGGTVASNLLKIDRFNVANAAIRSNAISRNGYKFTGTNNEISISFWVQGSAPTSGNQRIFDIFDSSGDGFSMRTGPSNTLIARFKNNGDDNQSSQSGLAIYNGDWHQVVFTIKHSPSGYDNRVYIDGVLHSNLSNGVDASNSSNFLSSNATFRLSPLSGSQGYFSNIDDIEIFNRELTPLEVYSIFLNRSPDVIYVNQNATGNNDGSSWADAFTNLQSAINSASNNDQLWVASGTYLPTAFAVTSQQTTRDKTFLLKKPLFIYGGFNGSETSLSERDINTNSTILSGDLNADDNTTITTVETTRQDNAYHVVTVKGNFSNGGELDGFTISGGNSNSTDRDLDCATDQTQQYIKERGAAIYANPDSAGRAIIIKIKNCVIENNSAIGMAALYSSNPCGASNTLTDINFENTIIRNNYSIDFSTIRYSASAFGIKSYGSLVNCLVYDNTTINEASAITLSANSSHVNNLNVKIINSTFSKNNGNTTVFNLNNAQKAVIANSVVYGNSGSSFANVGQSPTAQNNIIEGGFLASINQDPLFTDASNNDFTLQASSPAIDSGDNSLVPNAITTDLLGNQRVFNTTVDMGAYEFGSSSLSVDNFLNDDKISIYPNPVSSILNIRITSEVKKVIIYNLQGQKILESISDKIDVSNFSKGIYMLKVITENNRISTKKFIKN
ncbi:T9SS type A sorting domain-containing protein [Polaribacter haliotis]|uniref:T9SS type A sorting domain-containing protein n=1 Tax=Polaribacter haliotis TaxID=1888915 RepID=A0A7L8ACK6_9FLAO|nr:LamG-like jellyroll fold domain-containing protein [Polaribacter haliotis]QOD59722.1 T9SS type A sorting domain-containing protein [Polaribacter haliotis]